MLYRGLIVLSLALLLQGCIAAAAVLAAGGAATASGMLASDPRTFQVIKEDKDIASQINDKIANDPQMTSVTHISASSYNHVVLLTGEAYTAALRKQAADYAQQITKPPVKRIFNEITIGVPVSASVTSKDATITTKIKARMLATENLKSNNFKIVTENGTVFIMGIASRTQANMAADVAQKTEGVKRVVKLVEYEQMD